MALTLWHVTNRENAQRIRVGGFRNSLFRERADLLGVYFADRPTWDGMSGSIPPGCVGIAAVSNLPPEELEKYQVQEQDSHSQYVEWFIPADIVNKMDLKFVSGDHGADEGAE